MDPKCSFEHRDANDTVPLNTRQRVSMRPRHVRAAPSSLAINPLDLPCSEEGPRQTETPNFLRHKLLSYQANHQLLMSAILLRYRKAGNYALLCLLGFGRLRLRPASASLPVQLPSINIKQLAPLSTPRLLSLQISRSRLICN